MKYAIVCMMAIVCLQPYLVADEGHNLEDMYQMELEQSRSIAYIKNYPMRSLFLFAVGVYIPVSLGLIAYQYYKIASYEDFIEKQLPHAKKMHDFMAPIILKLIESKANGTSKAL